MRYGLVIATESEMEVFHRRYRVAKTGLMRLKGFTALRYKILGQEVWAVQSGAGEIRAAAATQALLSEFSIDAILNFGVCGGLDERIPLAQPLIVSNVIHYDFDISGVDGCEPAKYEQYPSVHIPADLDIVYAASGANPGILRVTCASGDKFLDSSGDKRSLHHRFETAQICDMEAAGILLTANMSNTPALLIKAVSDGVTGGAEEYHNTLDSAAESCLDALEKYLNQIWEVQND